MTGQTCASCAHVRRHWRGTTPRYVCTKYRKPAVAVCLDHRTRPQQIAAAINYLKSSTIK